MKKKIWVFEKLVAVKFITLCHFFCYNSCVWCILCFFWIFWLWVFCSWGEQWLEEKGKCQWRAREGVLKWVWEVPYLGNGLFCFVLEASVLECSTLIGIFDFWVSVFELLVWIICCVMIMFVAYLYTAIGLLKRVREIVFLFSLGLCFD